MVSLEDDCENKEEMETEEPTQKAKQKTVGSVLDAFTLLMDKAENLKLSGGCKLLAYLSKNLENEKEKEYILNRLIRSLGTNQLINRTGYFSSLVAVLRILDNVTVAKLLEIISKELHANNTSKSEVGDVNLGKILVCSAIFRSGLIHKASEDEQKQVMDLLLKSSTKKTYLSTAAYLILAEFSITLESEQFKTIVWNNVKDSLKKPMTEQSVDTLYFLLITKEKFPDTVKVKKFLGVSEIICEDTIHEICNKLMTIIEIGSTNHPIYPLIGKTIANSEHLKLFWTSGIEPHLTKHNRNREVAALTILSSILEGIKSNFEVIPELLSANFFKLFFDWFKGLKTASKVRSLRDDEDDSKLMIKKEKAVMDLLIKALNNDAVSSSTRVEVLQKLLLENGDLNFSEITGTNTVRTIMAKLDQKGVKKLAKALKAILLGESKKQVRDAVERNWYNFEKQRAGEYLAGLISHQSVTEEKEWRLKNMKLLMCYGFFKVRGNEELGISADLAGSMKACFYRCLNSKMATVESLIDILRSLCNFINENTQQPTVKSNLEKQFPPENFECWSKLVEITEKIDQGQNNSKIDNVFLILFYQLGLFLFSEPKYVKMARSSINELVSCYERCKATKKKKNKSLKEGDLTQDEPEWIEVLIEVLLSLLSQESHILRSIVQCSFKLLWEHMTPTSVGQLVSVLDPDSDENPLMNDSDDDSDSGSQSEEEGEKKDENSEGEDESSDESMGESDDDNIKIPDQLRMAVQKALGNAAPETDTESIDADNITEEEGKKLDDALAGAFKILSQGKKEKSKEDRKNSKALTDFRIRVLDLVDIYLERDPPMEICLTMLSALMRSLEFSLQDSAEKPLENRLRKTLKCLTKIRKFSSVEGVTEDLLCDSLKATIEKGNRTSFLFQALGDKITDCGSFIVHCMLKIQKTPKPKKKTCKITEIYKGALNEFFKNRNCLLPSIFFHSVLQIEWSGSYALAREIIENAFDVEVRQYRRNEALELLHAFLAFLLRVKPENITQTLKPILELFNEKALTALTNEKFVAKELFYKVLNKIIDAINKIYSTVEDKVPIDLKHLHTVIIGSKKGMIKQKGHTGTPKENGNEKVNVNGDGKKKKKKRKNTKRSKSESAGEETVVKKVKSS